MCFCKEKKDKRIVIGTSDYDYLEKLARTKFLEYCS
jgi:hypothetical protein